MKTTQAQLAHRRKIHAAAIEASKKMRVAWECPHCGHRHAWRWERFDCEFAPGIIVMHCDMCESDTRMRLEQIGADTYAAFWIEHE